MLKRFSQRIKIGFFPCDKAAVYGYRLNMKWPLNNIPYFARANFIHNRNIKSSLNLSPWVKHRDLR